MHRVPAATPTKMKVTLQLLHLGAEQVILLRKAEGVEKETANETTQVGDVPVRVQFPRPRLSLTILTCSPQLHNLDLKIAHDNLRHPSNREFA